VSPESARLSGAEQSGSADGEPPTRNPLSEVISRVDIRSIRLRSSHMHYLASGLDSDWADDADLFWFVDLASEAGDDVLVVIVACVAQHWADRGTAPEGPRSDPTYDDDAPPDLEVLAQFEVRWGVRDPGALSQEDLQTFCDFNPIVNVWPFWREYLQSQTGRMGVPPMVLPVLRVPRNPAEASEP